MRRVYLGMHVQVYLETACGAHFRAWVCFGGERTSRCLTRQWTVTELGILRNQGSDACFQCKPRACPSRWHHPKLHCGTKHKCA